MRNHYNETCARTLLEDIEEFLDEYDPRYMVTPQQYIKNLCMIRIYHGKALINTMPPVPGGI